MANILSLASRDNALVKIPYPFLSCSFRLFQSASTKSKQRTPKKVRLGIQIAKKIGDEMKRAAENGSLSLTINDTVIFPDEHSLEIMEPKSLCSTGQSLKGTYCRKFVEYMHLLRDTVSSQTPFIRNVVSGKNFLSV